MNLYDYIKRKKFIRTNKYQRKIILLALIPSLVVCLLTTLVIVYFQKELINLIRYSADPPSARIIKQWGSVIIIGLWLFCGVMIFWAYFVSSNLVGAFVRIIHELDDILGGKKSASIQARANDELANDLLRRINVLLEERKRDESPDSS